MYVEKVDTLSAHPAVLPMGRDLTPGSTEHDASTPQKMLASQLLVTAPTAALSSREPSTGRLFLFQIRSLILQSVEGVTC